jgi:chromosome partitioning protein
MKIVAVMNQKGGVGKTTTTCNLGAALGRAGSRVLLVDLDPQAHLSLHLSHDVNAEKPSIYEVMVEGLAVEQAIVATEAKNVWLLPAHIDLASAELELAGEIGRETILRNALATVAATGRFDVAIVDCPPSLGLLSLNGLTASDEVLIPLQAEFFALHGISRLTDVLQKLQRRLARGPQLLGIVLCRMQTTTRLAREVEEEARSHFGGRVFKTAIRQNVRLAEASSHGKSIFDYDPASQGAKDYQALAVEVLAAWNASASTNTNTNTSASTASPPTSTTSIAAAVSAPPVSSPAPPAAIASPKSSSKSSSKSASKEAPKKAPNVASPPAPPAPPAPPTPPTPPTPTPVAAKVETPIGEKAAVAAASATVAAAPPTSTAKPKSSSRRSPARR